MEEDNVINEVRKRLDIVDIIGSYLPLVQRGRNFFGVCPFHDDTNPSMSVSREKQIYTCFSCGATGNVFNFVMDYEHIGFREALILLAQKAGITLKNMAIHAPKEKNEPLYEIYRLAHKYYQNNLNTNLGKEARIYLKSRNLSDQIIKEFKIGLALDEKNSLMTLLTKKGYTKDTLENIGLTNDDHDVYFNRIMFPLHDISGHIVGFSGRIYDNSKHNKYLNTKETVIFKKGQMLYHYASAKEIVRTVKKVIIMEGFMDVIRASTIDINYTIALMGTAMTDEQANLIKRLSENVILCFDGDSAGKKATLTNGEHLESLGLHPKVIALNNDYDPDTYILEFGKEKFETLIENAINFSDYKLQLLKEGVNFNSDEETANYINQVLKETSKIEDEIRREIILKNLASSCNISYNTLEKRLSEFMSKKPKEEKLVPVKKVKKRYNKYELAIFSFLYYMLLEPKVINRYEQEKIYLPFDTARFLASEISYYYLKNGVITIADFYTYLTDKKELLTYLNQILSLDLNDTVSEEAISDYIKVINEYNADLEIKKLKAEMEKEVDEVIKAQIADRIRLLKMGS